MRAFSHAISGDDSWHRNPRESCIFVYGSADAIAGPVRAIPSTTTGSSLEDWSATHHPRTLQDILRSAGPRHKPLLAVNEAYALNRYHTVKRFTMARELCHIV